MASKSSPPRAAPRLALVKNDAWLAPFEPVLRRRQQRLPARLAEIEQHHGSLLNYATAHQQLGLHHDAGRGGWVYREWAPAPRPCSWWATSTAGTGRPTRCKSWSMACGRCFCPMPSTASASRHGSRYKVHVVANGQGKDRLPATLRRAVQDEATKDFAAQVWRPETPFAWTDQKFSIATAVPRSRSFTRPTSAWPPRKAGSAPTASLPTTSCPASQAVGYNAIQLMAVQEHPYYGSFGYHVANFFAASSRFGTPEDLKYLIDEAHRRGLARAARHRALPRREEHAEGLADFDGSGNQYFHDGERGNHPGWDCKLFDYGRPEVQQFLLSNLRYWLEEFHFDGFRFDGVTSMLYHHHGQGEAFVGYDDYFGANVDEDAILYLQLATTLAHEFKNGSLLIAEDMSGMPGLCRPVNEGGVGFDYRLAMGMPDYWIKLLKDKPDEHWNLGELWHTLTNRRRGEKTIAYAESHDQALVGDKTLAPLADGRRPCTAHMDARDADPGAARAWPCTSSSA